MPVDYSPPSWLQRPDSVGPYAAGLRQSQQLAQQLQLQREHLSHQAVLAQMEAQIKQDQAEKENMLAQQRIQVGAAYQQQEVALRQQEIQQNEQKLQQATQLAARKYQIGQTAAARIAAGESPAKVWGELGPEMTGTMAGLGSVLRAGEAGPNQVPQVMTLPGTGGRQAAYNPHSGAFQLLDRDQQVQNRQMALEQVRAKRAQLKDAQTAHNSDPIRPFAMKSPEDIAKLDPSIQAQIKGWQDEGNKLKQGQVDLDRMLAPQEQGGGGGAASDQAAAPSNRLRWNPELGVAEPIPQNPEEDEANLEPVQ